jgi:5-methyltetrahydrofolate--homocysteine methyltransferase
MANMNEKMKQLLIAGDAATLETIIQLALDAGASASSIIDDALLPGMDVVGQRMKTGEMFIPEVLRSAKTMHSALAILTPLLGDGEKSCSGTCVIGTVAGDLHDIGKNMVRMMLEGSGFNVVDLGIDVNPAGFAKAVEEINPDILAMSALLSTTMPKMRKTIEYLKEVGLRDRVKILVGGAPVTEDFAKEIGADGYGFNAADAVEKAKEFVAKLS